MSQLNNYKNLYLLFLFTWIYFHSKSHYISICTFLKLCFFHDSKSMLWKKCYSFICNHLLKCVIYIWNTIARLLKLNKRPKLKHLKVIKCKLDNLNLILYKKYQNVAHLVDKSQNILRVFVSYKFLAKKLKFLNNDFKLNIVEIAPLLIYSWTKYKFL